MARSKAYPTANLPECIALADKVWRKHDRKMITLDEAAQALEYKGVSGPSRSKISAMKQYGLLDEQPNGALKLSARAIAILHKEKGDPARAEAIQAAFRSVDLFTDLQVAHAESSLGAIERHLLTDHEFSPVGAKRAASSFLESLEFANASGDGKISLEDESEDDSNEEQDDDPRKPPLGNRPAMKREMSSIGEGLASLEWPVTRTSEEWEDLKYWLSGVVRKAKRDVQSDDEAADEKGNDLEEALDAE